MHLDYAAIFAIRGERYHRAMTRSPGARAAEFARLFDRHPVEAGQHVLDLPAGGGYLGSYLPRGARLTARELTPGFHGNVEVVPLTGTDLTGLGPFDHAVCLAALHHVEDPAAVLARMAGRLAPGGVLHFADVAQGSGISRFLDGFVGRYNETGHDGRYLDADALPLSPDLGGAVTRVEDAACPWHFADEAEMLAFCSDLFGLSDCPRQALLDALARDVGIDATGDGICLRWRLTYVDVQPG
ncbi:class I SAM-dependent methyltransferase [Cognatilysobacter segetis]|uniref:class I SAM-dependent methyltransferase n=1 Tax=Cognatilysobacter segetis TaxID=2492394 RepID=UPI00105D9E3E|nr:methyltransferase [Lysobacter segetis]